MANENDMEVASAYTKAKTDFSVAFEEFQKNVFTSKLLPENKSEAVKKSERGIIDKFVHAAVNLNNLNVSEGTIGFCTALLYDVLALRDRANEAEYKLLKMRKDLGLDKKGNQAPQPAPPPTEATDGGSK